jgi:hypothetical protein
MILHLHDAIGAIPDCPKSANGIRRRDGHGSVAMADGACVREKWTLLPWQAPFSSHATASLYSGLWRNSNPSMTPPIPVAVNSLITPPSVAVGNVSTTSEEQFRGQDSELDTLALGAGTGRTTHEIGNSEFNLNNKYYL